MKNKMLTDERFSLELLIADEDVLMTGRLDVPWAGMIVGALSADPFTVEELWYALQRFVPDNDLPPDWGLNRRAIARHAPWSDIPAVDGLDCIIDLPGRMLMTNWDQSAHPIPAGRYEHDLSDGKVIHYSLGPQWQLSSDFSTWPRDAPKRRAEQRTRWTVDFRTTLYGTPLLTFLVEQSWPWVERLLAVDTTPGGSPNQADWQDARSSAVRQLYQRWLDQRPDSLCGRSVREVLLEDQEHLASDMCSRETQWAQQRRAPLELRDTDTAYRFAGIGVHESILYDEMFGVLADAYLERAESLGQPPADFGPNIDWLRQRRDHWLWQPDTDNLMGQTPREVIDHERRRRPFVVEDTSHIGHDDCPLCQMMVSPEHGPVFCRLDGCYSRLTAVREGFDDEGSDDDSDCDDSSEEKATTDDQGNAVSDQRDSGRNASCVPRANSVWNSVGIFTPPGETTVVVELFTVAACTGELVEDLKARSAERDLIDSLLRHVGNLSASLSHDSPELVGPVVSRFCECLDEVERVHTDLAEKIEDLQPRLLNLMQLADG
jgi:hypothetical protein